MGLDMYLTAKRYLCGGKWVEENERNLNQKVRDLFPEMYRSGNLDSAEVAFEVGYWRKANQIHKWFVDNIQDGNDDCGYYKVSRESLKQLKEICQQVLKIAKLEDGIVVNDEFVKKILPTQDGFFFGSNNIDEYYINDIKETIKIIDKCLKLPERWDLFYHSSW